MAQSEDFKTVSLVRREDFPVAEAPAPRERGLITALQFLECLEQGGDVSKLIPQTFSAEAAARKVKGRKLKDKEHPEEYERLLQTRPPLPPPFGERSKFEVTMKERELKEFFSGSPNWTPVPSVPRDRRDPHYKEGGGLTNLTTIALTQTSYNKAIDVANRLIQLPFEDFTPFEIREAWAWLEKCWDYHVTNGPVNGLYRRIKASTYGPKPRMPGGPILETLKRGIETRLPFEMHKVADMRGKSIKECASWVILNWKAGSGFPWNKPKKEVFEQAYTLATEILTAIAEGKAQKLAQDSPQLELVQLKNKLDLYKYEETKDSIRQYFVYPFSWTILWSCVAQNYTHGYVGFWDDPKSMNAHGFSWNKGGGDRLYRWVLWAKEQGPGMRAIAYSDDQLWVIVTADGRCYVMAPDIKRMDLSLASWWGRLHFEHLIPKLRGTVLDKTWEAVFNLNCRRAFDCLTIIGNALTYRSENFLHSGVVGTAEFDQTASAGIFEYLQQLVGTCSDKHDFQEKLTKALAEVKRALGITFKPETLEMHEFLPDAETYPWSFLGKRLFRRYGHYVPGSDPVRALASMTSPKKKLPGLALISAQMTRCRDIVASGAYIYPQIYFAAKHWFDVQIKMKNRPKDDLEVVESEPSGYRGPIDLPDWGLNFPSEAEILELYLPPGVKVVEMATGTAVTGVVPTVPQKTVSDVLGDMYSNESWGDSEPGTAERTGADKGDISFPQPARIPVEQQGRVRPLPPDVKLAYNARLRDIYRQRLLQAGGVRGFTNPPSRFAKRRGQNAKHEKMADFMWQRIEEGAGSVEEASIEEYYLGTVPDDFWESNPTADDLIDLDEEMERRAYLRRETESSY